jgi:hypothetical protein
LVSSKRRKKERTEDEKRGDEGGVEPTRHASDQESCIKPLKVTKTGIVVSPLGWGVWEASMGARENTQLRVAAERLKGRPGMAIAERTK